MSGVTIGEAARRAGVGVETIRFYERRGLIQQPAKPPDSGFRVYSPEQIERIKFIRRAQQIGFSLGEIEELLSLRADPNADCADVREQAAAKLDEVERKLEQLRQIRAALQAVLAVCPGSGGLQACTILDTLVQPNAAIRGSRPLPATPPKRRPRNGSGGRQRRMP